MNKHIIVEYDPKQLRRNIMAALLSCSMFFLLGFIGRPFMEWQWDQLVGNAEKRQKYCAGDQTAGTPKRTLQWRLPDEPKKSP
jgi:hypothetical protein